MTRGSRYDSKGLVILKAQNRGVFIALISMRLTGRWHKTDALSSKQHDLPHTKSALVKSLLVHRD